MSQKSTEADVSEKVGQLLDAVERIELAAKRGLEINKDHIPGIPAEKTISAKQCEWTLKDCQLFRGVICRIFGLPR